MGQWKRWGILGLGLWVAVLVILVGPRGLEPLPQTSGATLTLTVSAASDLSDVFPLIGALWTQETGHRVVFNLGSTGQLAQQIERGAAVDLFAAANRRFVEDLDQGGLIVPGSKALYGVGRLTLWQRQEGTLPLNALQDLTQPAVQRIAIANPDHAPYGMAAREALQTVGLWETLQPKLVMGENIRQAQQYAETGNVDVAIAALSLSVERPGHWTLIPEALHRPLEQMLAIPTNAPHPEAAQSFATFINGPQGRPLMQRYGFILPGEPPFLGTEGLEP